MNTIQLKDIDPEDIEDVLRKVETSFDITFKANELAHVNTFGDICDHIKDKVSGQDTNDCTSQQAFYKLKDALMSVLKVSKDSLTPNKLLVDILPRKGRKNKVKLVEKELGFKLSVLKAHDAVSGSLLIVLLLSIIFVAFNWQIGLGGSVFAILSMWVANKTGIELNVSTIGELAEKMSQENYVKSRRHHRTINKNEIEKVLTDLFSRDLSLDPDSLSRETKLT